MISNDTNFSDFISHCPLSNKELANFTTKIKGILGYDNILSGMAITENSDIDLKAITLLNRLN